MLKGFKDFIMRGNVIDLAVGVIIGGAFSTVVNALVESVIMPAISMLVGSPNFDDFLVFGQIKVGVFLTALVNFLLVAAALYFCIVMPINTMNARRARKLGLEEEDETEPEVALLTEIRDALISNKNVTGASSYVDPEANKN
ncbi:large conductance mechanosensitive channel protein MscL [Kocuria koreensis]|jgi:large conductance mechanosensitive channel|uniref:Large-conductance mechanosensitive channel n=1 Tax=Rothia koreensis TaxID=592378 RepID=A0A7K1LFD0_9MICC|nr:large conductance mechanosensitive channel protein MscL [Rothia koreensis]MUN53820.1 large conductance mechanosensitive channel protein MscL [Rothia koreensis]